MCIIPGITSPVMIDLAICRWNIHGSITPWTFDWCHRCHPWRQVAIFGHQQTSRLSLTAGEGSVGIDTIVVLLFYRGDSHSPHVICKVRLKKMDLPKRVLVFSYLSIHRLYVCLKMMRWCLIVLLIDPPFSSIWKSIENSNRKSNESTPCTWGCTDGTVLSLVNLKISWRTWDAPSWESLWNHYGSRAQLASFFRTDGCVTVWGTSPDLWTTADDFRSQA